MDSPVGLALPPRTTERRFIANGDGELPPPCGELIDTAFTSTARRDWRRYQFLAATCAGKTCRRSVSSVISTCSIVSSTSSRVITPTISPPTPKEDRRDLGLPEARTIAKCPACADVKRSYAFRSGASACSLKVGCIDISPTLTFPSSASKQKHSNVFARRTPTMLFRSVPQYTGTRLKPRFMTSDTKSRSTTFSVLTMKISSRRVFVASRTVSSPRRIAPNMMPYSSLSMGRCPDDDEMDTPELLKGTAADVGERRIVDGACMRITSLSSVFPNSSNLCVPTIQSRSFAIGYVMGDVTTMRTRTTGVKNELTESAFADIRLCGIISPNISTAVTARMIAAVSVKTRLRNTGRASLTMALHVKSVTRRWWCRLTTPRTLRALILSASQPVLSMIFRSISSIEKKSQREPRHDARGKHTRDADQTIPNYLILVEVLL
eukprot:PhM_4_TR5211/c0_g1_i1/m.103692